MLPLVAFSLQQSLDALLDAPALRGATVCAYVGTLDGKTIYERNPALRVVPASNEKLLSVSYALHRLGKDYAPTTRIWKLSDRVVVDSPGDPSLTYDALKAAAAKLGLKERVPVYVRQAYRPEIPPSWEFDDLPNRYAPRITALTVDRGAFQLWSVGRAPMLKPETYGVRIMHFPGGKVRTSYDPFGELLVVRGDLPEKDVLVENLSIPHPDRTAAAILGGPLFEHSGPLPEGPTTLTLKGMTVGELAKACLQPSDNFLAESLFLMAASSEGPLGEDPYGVASKRLKEFLVKVVGVVPEDVRPYDGSGMSRHNYVTVRALATVLRWAKVQPTSKLWEDSLARPGVGTLAARLTGSTFVGKTGTVEAVAALSGYVTAPDGKTLVVSLIFNGILAGSAEVRAIADAFVRQLEKPSTFGTEFVALPLCERPFPYASPRPADAHRLYGPDGDRVAPRARTDRGAKSSDEGNPQPKRMAVCAR